MDESGRQLARGEIKIWTDGGREGGREGEGRRKGAEDRFSFSFPPPPPSFFVPSLSFRSPSSPAMQSWRKKKSACDCLLSSPNVCVCVSLHRSMRERSNPTVRREEEKLGKFASFPSSTFSLSP